MKFQIEHIAALGLAVLLAYKMGQAAGKTASEQAPSNEITGTAQWWTYAGQWGM